MVFAEANTRLRPLSSPMNSPLLWKKSRFPRKLTPGGPEREGREEASEGEERDGIARPYTMKGLKQKKEKMENKREKEWRREGVGRETPEK